MANLNLSQFGEKLFVADADHTFIWDTAASISKRVSRNSWLNSGTLATSAPVTISQTWNAVGQTFKALVVNAAGTSDANSASGSLLADFQVNGTTKANITKYGSFIGGLSGTSKNPVVAFPLSGSYSVGVYSPASYTIQFAMSGTNGGADTTAYTGLQYEMTGGTLSWGLSSVQDIKLVRDGAPNTLALRNGAAAQTFNVYGTSSSSNTVYERMFAKYNSTDLAFQIGTETASATLRPLDFVTGGSRRMTIGTTGNVGIGTTAPASGLHVAGALGSNTTTYDSAAALKLTNTNVNSSWLLTSGVVGVLSSAFSIRQEGIALPALTIVASTNNVGIGTTAPSSKLQVSAGDVEVDTIAKGVILKSPDGTRYRVTVANGGTLSVAAV